MPVFVEYDGKRRRFSNPYKSVKRPKFLEYVSESAEDSTNLMKQMTAKCDSCYVPEYWVWKTSNDAVFWSKVSKEKHLRLLPSTMKRKLRTIRHPTVLVPVATNFITEHVRGDGPQWSGHSRLVTFQKRQRFWDCYVFEPNSDLNIQSRHQLSQILREMTQSAKRVFYKAAEPTKYPDCCNDLVIWEAKLIAETNRLEEYTLI